jgi:hypothetical protein
MMLTSEVPEDQCPFCQHHLDRVTASPTTPHATPLPGDITVCIQCGGLLIFGPELKVRPPTPEEQAEAMTYPEVATFIHAIALAHGRTADGNDA